MKNDLSSKTILSVFDYIQRHGDKQSQGYFYQGITAFTDFDGYTLYLQGSGVLMRFGFHNTYHLDYQSEKNKSDFLAKVTSIHQLIGS